MSKKPHVFALPTVAPEVVGHLVLLIAQDNAAYLETIERKLTEENEFLACVPFILAEKLGKDDDQKRIIAHTSLLTILALSDQLATDVLEDWYKKKRARAKRTKKKYLARMVARRRPRT